MAIYHLAIKAIGRSSGRSVTAAVAYRTGKAMYDARTGRTHKYRDPENDDGEGRIKGTRLVLPKGSPNKYWGNRQLLWSDNELAHKRKDATPAMEIEVALPHDISIKDRTNLAYLLAERIAERHKVPVDVAIHISHHGKGGNWHAHLVIGMKRLGPNGFGERANELDPWWCEKQKEKVTRFADVWRPIWDTLVNAALSLAGVKEKVSHKTLRAQGIDRQPQVHKGPKLVAYQRRLEDKASELMRELEDEIEGPSKPLREQPRPKDRGDDFGF